MRETLKQKEINNKPIGFHMDLMGNDSDNNNDNNDNDDHSEHGNHAALS